MIIKVETVAELDNLILHSSALVMDFFADWCGPCKNLGKFLEKIKDQDEFKNVVFCKVNVDIAEFENICAKYHVSGIPHVVFFKNSKEIDTVVGFSESKILDTLKRII
jgi:thioredoxin 1